MSYFPLLDESQTSWIQILTNSDIGQFSSYQVENLIRAHVPMWILWDICNIDGQWQFHPLLHNPCACYVNAQYYPSDQDLIEAYKKACGLPPNIQPQLSLIVPSNAYPNFAGYGY